MFVFETLWNQDNEDLACIVITNLYQNNHEFKSDFRSQGLIFININRISINDNNSLRNTKMKYQSYDISSLFYPDMKINLPPTLKKS